MDRFIIPRRDDDLLRPVADAYYVERVVDDEGEIHDVLEAFRLSVEQGEHSKVAEWFDAFFSLIRQSSDLHRHEFSAELKAHSFEMLATGLENSLQPLKSHLEDVVNSPLLTPELIATSEELSNFVMMYVYLLSRLTNHLEGYVEKSSRLAQQSLASPSRRGRKAQPAAFTQDEVVQFWLGTEGRERILRLIHCLVRLKVLNVESRAKVNAAIRYLWVPDVVDKRLIGCLLDTLTRLLETPDTAKASGRPILNAVFAIIRDLCVHLGETEQVCDTLMGLAFRLEVLHQPACTNFHFIDAILGAEKREGELRPLLAQMVAYVGSVDVQAFRARGESSGRVICLFITTLAERRPQFLYTHLAYIVPFLSFDPSSLRNAVLTAFTDILISDALATNNADGEDGMRDVEGKDVDAEKLGMLRMLQEHIIDVNSYVRARSLNLWIKLAKSRSVPMEQLGFSLVTDATGRLNDSSVMVRKAAANLLQTLLTYNPFGSDLNYRPAVKELKRVKTRHEELLNSKEHMAEAMTNGTISSTAQHHAFDPQLPSTSTANIDDDDTDALMEEHRQETLDREIKEAEAAVERAMLRLCFITELETAQSTAIACLRRTSEVGELQELMRFVQECRKFRLRGAQHAMNSVFMLIWRKDHAINELVIQAAESLFMNNPNGEALAKRSIDNLMDVTMEASVEEWLSLEEALVCAVKKRKRLPIQMVDLLWDIVIADEAELEKKLAAVRLMGVFGRARPVVLRQQFGRISQLYTQSECDDLRIELLRCCVLPIAKSPHQLGRQRPFRLPSSDPFITALTKTLIDQVMEISAKRWMPHCHEAVPLFFGMTARPYIVISAIYAQLAQATQCASDDYRNASLSLSSPLVERDGSVLPPDTLAEMNGGLLNGGGEALSEGGGRNPEEGSSHEVQMIELKTRWELTASRFLFFIGEMADGFIVYLEDTFSTAMKDSLQRMHDLRQKADAEGEGASLENLVAFNPAEDTPLSQFEKDSIRQRGFFEKADREDDRIGLTAISEEDKLQMKTQNLLDKETFETQTIFGRVLPLLLRFIKIDVGSELKEQAVASLAKMMLINMTCCKKFLPTLFDYYREASSRARNNLLAMMNDLWFRFPNCFNSFIDEFIEKLKDSDAGVRLTCLYVLSHMILNDILNGGSQVADLAACLYDTDENVAQLAKVLFTDMGKKHNLLYNALPDVLERLVNESELHARKLDELVQFLASFVAKDQQRLRLVERLKEKLDTDQFRRVQPYFKVSSQLQQEQAMNVDTLDEDE